VRTSPPRRRTPPPAQAVPPGTLRVLHRMHGLPATVTHDANLAAGAPGYGGTLHSVSPRPFLSRLDYEKLSCRYIELPTHRTPGPCHEEPETPGRTRPARRDQDATPEREVCARAGFAAEACATGGVRRRSLRHGRGSPPKPAPRAGFAGEACATKPLLTETALGDCADDAEALAGRSPSRGPDGPVETESGAPSRPRTGGELGKMSPFPFLKWS
jgi:hypothetical protein